MADDFWFLWAKRLIFWIFLFRNKLRFWLGKIQFQKFEVILRTFSKRKIFIEVSLPIRLFDSCYLIDMKKYIYIYFFSESILLLYWLLHMIYILKTSAIWWFFPHTHKMWVNYWIKKNCIVKENLKILLNKKKPIYYCKIMNLINDKKWEWKKC